MKGAIVFLIVFVIVLIATLGYSGLPPGAQIYGMLGVPETDYPVLGMPATTLIVAIFNGVIYGVVVWLIFTLLGKAGILKK